MSNLYVIAVLSNPVRFKSRWKLYEQFAKHVGESPGAQLVTVELAHGHREHQVTVDDNGFHIQVRAGAESEVWVKESLINIGFRELYKIDPDWKYAAWIDADVQFLRPDWAKETIEALQHWKLVQPWSFSIDMGPHYAPIGFASSFCRDHYFAAAEAARNGQYEPMEFLKHSYCGKMRDGHKTFHPGYAWAIRRSAWEKIGPLVDWNPMGSGDNQMAWAFAGNIQKAINGKATEGYRRRAQAFQDRCDKHLKRDIGYVDGTLVHNWHGKKRERYYVEREKTLVEVGFDPETDITFNHQGLLVLTDRNIALRDAVRRYFRSRHEDSTDLD
jgi:hypothetical protein